MVYTPENPPVVENVEQLSQWVFSEFQKISQSQSETTALDLRTVHKEPARPREGMIIQADGTDWDPGEGEGPYIYQGGIWNLLSFTPNLSPFLESLAIQVYTTGSGTYTPPAGAVAFLVFVTGGGGGGGGADSDGSGYAAGAGGEAGGTAIKLFNAAEMGANAAYAVGAGGAGGANTGGNGGDGSNSTFNPAGTGATLTGSGGDNGGGDTGTDNFAFTSGGDLEGTATNGDINAAGGHGENGFGFMVPAVGGLGTTSVVKGGMGGASFWGGGGRGRGSVDTTPDSLAGRDGVAPGSGGGGAIDVDNTTGNAGGAGADGIIVVIAFVT